MVDDREHVNELGALVRPEPDVLGEDAQSFVAHAGVDLAAKERILPDELKGGQQILSEVVDPVGEILVTGEPVHRAVIVPLSVRSETNFVGHALRRQVRTWRLNSSRVT